MARSSDHNQTQTRRRSITDLAGKYESGNNPASFNPNDAGTAAYGIIQINGRERMNNFINYMDSAGGSTYANQLRDTMGSYGQEGGAFTQTWRNISTNDAAGFTQYQSQWAVDNYYLSNVNGLDITKCSDAVQASVMSASIQQGPGGANTIVSRAVDQVGGPAKAYENQEALIGAIYDQRTAYSPEFADRYASERQDALSYHRTGDFEGRTGTVSTVPSGTSGATASTGGTSGGADTNVLGEVVNPRGILGFAQFASSIAFKEMLTMGFQQEMEQSLHDYVVRFMRRFYHNIVYIPTLPMNKAIVVKPEIFFADPPSCNVIYPSMRVSSNTQYNPKAEPTRLAMISDPVSYVTGVNSPGLFKLVTIAYMDYLDKARGTKTIKKISELQGQDITKPMGMISEYEKENGVRLTKTNAGGDLYLYLLSGGKADAQLKAKKGIMINTTGDTDGIGQTLFELARYMLFREIYSTRPGAIQTYFDPYVIPGFPCINLETANTSDLNTYAYVTDVIHQINERSWMTQISTTAAHEDNEPKPNAFPIIEDEYVKDIKTTYTKMLGPSVSSISQDGGIAVCMNNYTQSDGTFMAMLKKVWRPLTTMQEHLATVCDGAKIVDKGLYTTFEGSFFRTDVQKKMIEYTENILAGRAFSEADVR